MNEKIFYLAVEGMKGERRSSVLRALILFLSFMFVVVSLSVTESLNKTGEEYRYSQYGAWKSVALDATKADGETFAASPSIEKFGTAQLCGTVVDTVGMELTALGSLDENLIEIGRVSLQAGHMPETEQEIAMEADVLSSLGYDYSLGQNIMLSIQRGNQIIEKEYVLCGVIKEYTDIWSHGNGLLAGAVVCPKEALSMGNPICYQYFLMSDKTNAQLVREFGKGCSLTANEVMQGKNGEQETYWGFVAIILIATMATVFSLYFIQMTAKIRSLALLRGIGATKKQLIQKLFYETCCAAVPAILFGSIVGVAVTWGVLSVILTVDKENFRIDIPFGSLAIAGTIWLLATFFSQMLVLRLAFRQPLVGRVMQESKEIKRGRWRRNIGLAVLAGLFPAVGMLVYLQSLSFLYISDMWEDLSDYSLQKQGENYVTEETLQKVEQTLGVKDVFAVRQLQAALSFEGMEESSLVVRIREDGWQTQPWLTDTELFPQGIGVYVYGIRESDIENFLAEIGSSIDKDAFISGEQVILWFGNEDSMCETQADTGLSAGDEIMLDIYAIAKIEETGYSILESPVIVGEQTASVGEIMIRDAQEVIGYTGFGDHCYSVIASGKFVQSLLEENSGNGMVLNTGDVMGEGYSYATIKTGADAAFLSTDYAVSVIAGSAGNKFVNERELHAAYRQEARHGLIFLRLGGICIGMILLLLMWNILAGAGEETRKKYGILRALGMSKRQMTAQIIGKGIFFCTGAIAQASVLCTLYLICTPVDYFRLGFDMVEFGIICAAMLLILLLFYIVTQSRALRGTPMQLLGEERR